MFKYILIELEYYVIFIKILFPTEYNWLYSRYEIS